MNINFVYLVKAIHVFTCLEYIIFHRKYLGYDISMYDIKVCISRVCTNFGAGTCTPLCASSCAKTHSDILCRELHKFGRAGDISGVQGFAQCAGSCTVNFWLVCRTLHAKCARLCTKVALRASTCTKKRLRSQRVQVPAQI